MELEGLDGGREGGGRGGGGWGQGEVRKLNAGGKGVLHITHLYTVPKSDVKNKM